MSKIFFLKSLLLLYGMLFFASCNDEVVVDSISMKIDNNPVFDANGMLAFNSKEVLQNIIDQEGTVGQILRNSNTRAINGAFVSMMDAVKMDDPLLENFTEEEQQSIIGDAVTYYELLDFEELVPNENFAKLLNVNGDIQVNDTIYRITPYGTLYAAAQDADALEVAYNEMKEESLKFNVDESELKLSSKVSLINTFDHITFDNDISNEEIEENDIFIDKSTYPFIPKDPYPVYPPKLVGEDIPYHRFPRRSNRSHTWAGKLLGKALGDRSVKHHDFKDGYRVKGSFYDYDYGVYTEIGAFVAMRKKRGGYLKKINGWKGIKTDQLSIIYKGVVLELNYNLSKLSSLPSKATILHKDFRIELPGAGKELFCLDICGSEITDKDVMKLAGLGIKEALKELKKMTNSDISERTQAVRIFTQSKSYVVILDNQINEYDTKQIRKIFGKEVRFFISSTTIKDPLSLKALVDFVKGIKNLPVEKLRGGEVILAGKLHDDWGGLVLYKD